MAATIGASRRSPLRSIGLLVYVFVLTMLGTTLPTPLYPDYQHRFGFGQLTETVVFASYAVGVLATLMLFGRVSDVIGRRPMLFVSIGTAAVSTAVFILADSVHGYTGIVLLLAGRVLSGLSAGIMTGTATASISDAAGPGRGSLAGLIAAMAQICGLGLGPLVGGLLLEIIDDPLRLIYVIYLVALAIAVVAITAVPETVRRTQDRPSPLITPLRLSAVLAQANATGLVGFAGFAVLGLFTAVTPSFLDRLGQHAPISTGLVVFSVFAASALSQLSTMRLRPRTTLMVGVATLSAGAAVVGAGLHLPSIPVLVAGGLIAGAGQGMSFHAALSRATAASPPTERGAVASSFFVICYLGISLPVIGLGAATRAWGLLVAGQVFAAVVVAIGVTTLARLRGPERAPDRPDAGAPAG
jgi:predicted MFS family arabinose efflux permease